MNKSELDISNLKNCINALEECFNAHKTIDNEVMRGFVEDSCVKRFEFTVETSWKIMKKYLKLEYGKDDKELTMNNIFQINGRLWLYKILGSMERLLQQKK